MSVPLKISAYFAGVLAVFGAAAGVGAAVGSVGDPASAHTRSHPGSTMNTNPQQSSAAHDVVPGGLQVSQVGYTFDVARILPAGQATPVSFRILGRDGKPVS